MLKKHTLFEIRHLRESEDRVEFKKANQGLFSYNGSGKSKATDRRKCILGYVVAFCNEGGGELIFGVDDAYPHRIVGTQQNENQLGQLESDIYRDVGIRTAVYELFENETDRTGRVLVIHIPGRPKGKLYKFEDVPLMRVGEELKVMPDDIIRDILLENENDFSAEICPAATLDDLDAEAIEILKRKYAAKQRNTHFLTLDHTQILSDLGLIVDGQLTYAALILVGKTSALARLLPQAKIVLEYRHDSHAIPYTNRTEYATCFFKTADRLWADINLRNDKIDISDGLYLLNLPLYNEEVVREAVNNAIAHRDYRCQSEIFVLQSPELLIVKNAGGFPRGVTLGNLLSVCSTPATASWPTCSPRRAWWNARDKASTRSSKTHSPKAKKCPTTATATISVSNCTSPPRSKMSPSPSFSKPCKKNCPKSRDFQSSKSWHSTKSEKAITPICPPTPSNRSSKRE